MKADEEVPRQRVSNLNHKLQTPVPKHIFMCDTCGKHIVHQTVHITSILLSPTKLPRIKDLEPPVHPPNGEVSTHPNNKLAKAPRNHI
jgi:hypothetical protein